MTSEEYGQYIDDFELGADVMPGESLTDYIERRRREFDSKADGGVIGIEVKIADEMAKGGRVGLFSGGALKGLASLFKGGKNKIDDIIETKATEKIGFRSRDDIPLSTYSEMKGPIKLSDMENIPEDQLKKILRTQELGLYEETPELLKAANLLERFTKKVKGKRVIDYERAEAILGVKLKGNETLDDLFKIEFETRPEMRADGGRVGLFMGGPPLEGQALDIYTSMNKYGFSDQEIADALAARGLYTPSGTTQPEQVTGIINQALNQNLGGGDGEGPPGTAPKGTKTYGKTFTGMTMPDGTPIGSSGVVAGPGVIDSLKNAATGLFNVYQKFSPTGIFSNFIKQRAEKQKEIQNNAIEKARLEREMKEKIRQEQERAAQYGPTNYGTGSDGQQSYDFGQGFGIGATTGGPVSNRTGRGRTDYSKGGLATRFKPRRR